MKTNNNEQIIPMSVFETAAVNFFKCKADEIEIRMIIENLEAFITFQGKGYKISTREAFRQDLAFLLIDKEAILHLFDHCWIEATRNLLNVDSLIEALAGKISGLDDAQKLLVSVVLSMGTADPISVFWTILFRVDDTGQLFAAAMSATAKLYLPAGLLDSLLSLRIRNGIDIYNIYQSGVFETIKVEGDQSQYPEFYLYSVETFIPE